MLSRLQESHEAEAEKFRAEVSRMRERFREQGVELPDPDQERREQEAALEPADGGKPKLHFAMGRRASAAQPRSSDLAATDRAMSPSPAPAAGGAEEEAAGKEGASLSSRSPSPVDSDSAAISPGAGVSQETKEHKAGLMVLKAFLGRRSRHARKVCSVRGGGGDPSPTPAPSQKLSQFEAAKLFHGAEGSSFDPKGAAFVDPGQMYAQMKSKAKDVVSLKAEVEEKQGQLARLQGTLEDLYRRREELKYGCVQRGGACTAAGGTGPVQCSAEASSSPPHCPTAPLPRCLPSDP